MTGTLDGETAGDRPPRKGRYIALEGIDGAGKTTIGRILVAALEDRGIRCHWTHTPEYHGLGERILALWSEGHRLGGFAWPLLYAASSLDAQHRGGGHLDLLSQGIWVVTDRCALSTSAGFLGDAPEDAGWLLEIHREYVAPDVVVVLDVDPAVAARRVAERDGVPADCEASSRLRQRYGRAASACRGAGWTVVECTLTLEEAAVDAAAAILRMLDDEAPARGPRTHLRAGGSSRMDTNA